MVDSYLSIAQRVLERARRPLTPREILREAYRFDLVPYHLHGATQHKTLQARLSEHIVAFRDNGLFFRTAPGRFFLRAFLADETISAEFRTPIAARRRVRELRRKEVLTVRKEALPAELDDGARLPVELLYTPLLTDCFHYTSNLSLRSEDEVAIWSFVVVVRDTEILTYRQGRYREDRDGFLQRRSIGFYAPVIRSDRGLFDQLDHGLVAGGLETLAVDLDLATDPSWQDLSHDAKLHGMVYVTADNQTDLLGIVRLNFPKWFEPLTRRLAINDLAWQDFASPTNHVEDYDPWSQAVLDQAQSWARERAGSREAIRTGGD